MSHPTMKLTVHATDAADAQALRSKVVARVIDGYAPFVTVEIGNVDFFVHPDEAVALFAEVARQVGDLSLPTGWDAIRKAWRRDVDTDMSFGDWADEFFSFYDEEEDTWS